MHLRTSRLIAVSTALLALYPATASMQRSVAPAPIIDTGTVQSTVTPRSLSSSSSVSSTAPTRTLTKPTPKATPGKPITSLFSADTNDCPMFLSTVPTLPAPVQDMTKGDCSLKGKSAQVTAYLKKLKAAADKCKKEIPAAWAGAKKLKASLDATVEALPSPDPDQASPFVASSSCFSSGDTAGSFELTGGATPDGFKYSAWLDRIAKDTAKYCVMIRSLSQPLATTCASIAAEAQCKLTGIAANGISDDEKTAFHASINSSMKSVELQYKNLDAFYKKTLSLSGWGNFQKIYKEKNIACGGQSAPSSWGTKELE